MDIKNQHTLFYLTWLLLSIFVVVFACKSAINVDEVLHYNHAKLVLKWYQSGGQDASCLNTPKSHLKYYGQSVDNLSALTNKTFGFKDEYLTRHLIGGLVGIFLILLIGLISSEITKSYQTGIIAMLLFFISPRPMGQLVNNLKDIPFALGYIWAIYGMVKAFANFPKLHWKYVFHIALAIAFTNSVRMGGIVLLPYFALFMIIGLLLKPQLLRSTSFYKSWIIKSLVIVLIGYFGSLIFWPFGSIKPITNPFEALSVMSHYKISIRQLFEGEWIWSTDLPWYYLLKWLLISIPEVVWIGLLSFVTVVIAFTHKKKFKIRIGIVAFAFLFPTIYVILINANLYSGWRQMYFIYPPLIVLSSVGLYYIIRISIQRIAVGIITLLLLLSIHPASYIFTKMSPDYVYFNAISGGNRAAFSNYEYDYYWHHMKPAVQWLKENTNQNKAYLIATNFELDCYEASPNNCTYKYVHYQERNKVPFDYAVLGVNYIHPYQLQNNTFKPSNILFEHKHRGNPSLFITKRTDSVGAAPFILFKEKAFDEAIIGFKNIIDNDKNDLQARAFLAKCYFRTKNDDDFLKLIKESSALCPYYEPIILAKAEWFHRQKKYNEALGLLESIVKINNRYKQAIPLVKDCYLKNGQIEKANAFK